MSAKTSSALAAVVPHVDQYLSVGQQGGASDIHLGVNALPLWRLHGNLQPIWRDVPKLTAEGTAALAAGFLNETQSAARRTRRC
jgi:Tfp pilus assembly pilus retraction ATPase PilT